MDEYPSHKETAEDHCFWVNDEAKPDHSHIENEIFLYDEAEPLAYVCSETSLPPKSAFKLNLSRKSVRAKNSGSCAKLSFEGSVAPTTGGNLSEYYSVSSMSSEKRMILKKGPGDETNVQDFQKAILRKFNEFSQQSSKSLHQATEYFKNSAGSERSEKAPVVNNLEEEADGLKQLFVRKSPFLITSSDSDQELRFSVKCEDEFSTGVSDVGEEGRTILSNNDQPNSNGRPNQFHQLTTTSIIKTVHNINDEPRNEVSNSFERNSPPQRKLSVKQFNRPGNAFVEEIKKNNLVMKEVIFSSSKVKSNISGTSFEPTKIGDNGERLSQNVPDQFVRSRNNGGNVEVYESRGAHGNYKVSKKEAVVAEEMLQPPKTEAEMNCVSKERLTEVNQQINDNTYVETRHMKRLTQTSNCAKNDQAAIGTKCAAAMGTKDAATITNNEGTALLSLQFHTASGHDAKTNLTKLSRYVKLPGYPEAFGKDYGNVNELRINDGVSFESVNVFDALSPMQFPSNNQEICQVEKVIPDETNSARHWQMKLETKDVSTEFIVPIKHMLTQTSEMIPSKYFLDVSIQCEPYAIDDENSISNNNNQHREIMICDEKGAGVQLYNILGHPLTDMDGYLLKDSHGRFLVQLDHFGVPLSCTDGKTIFIEDGSEWEATKGSCSIIHQKFKNLITKPMKCESKSRQKTGGSNAHFGKAKTKRNRIEWSDNHLKDEETDNSRYSVSENVNPLRKIKIKPHSTNIIRDNTSTLVTEMESIAKLRYALMEKINYITDHRTPMYKPKLGSGNESRTRKSVKRSNPAGHTRSQDWKSEPRLHIDTTGSRRFSPTYCAIKSAVKRKKANQEMMKNFLKPINPPNPNGHFHRRNNDLSHTVNFLENSNESVIQTQYPLADNTEDTDAEINDRSWQSPQSADSIPILPKNQFMLGGKLYPIETWEGTAALNNVQPRHKWIALRPSIENDSEGSHDF